MEYVSVQHRFILIACHFKQAFSWPLAWLWYANISLPIKATL
jgi:hypothetical protein